MNGLRSSCGTPCGSWKEGRVEVGTVVRPTSSQGNSSHSLQHPSQAQILHCPDDEARFHSADRAVRPEGARPDQAGVNVHKVSLMINSDRLNSRHVSIERRWAVVIFTPPFYVAVFNDEFVEAGGIDSLTVLNDRSGCAGRKCLSLRSLAWRSRPSTTTLRCSCPPLTFSPSSRLRWTYRFSTATSCGSCGSGKSCSAGVDRVHGECWKNARTPCIRWLRRPSSFFSCPVNLCRTSRKCSFSSPEPLQATAIKSIGCGKFAPSCRAPAARWCRQLGAVWKLPLMLSSWWEVCWCDLRLLQKQPDGHQPAHLPSGGADYFETCAERVRRYLSSGCWDG